MACNNYKILFSTLQVTFVGTILKKIFDDYSTWRAIVIKRKNTSTHSREPITPASSAPHAQKTSVRLGRQPAGATNVLKIIPQ